MDRRQLLLAALLSITYRVYAQQGQHTVLAMVVGKGGQKLPEIKVNGVQMKLHSPQMNKATQESGALVQGPPSDTATYIVGKKASDGKPNQPVMAAALVMPSAPKPKTEHEKIMDELKLTKQEKEKLFPCDDYQPYCKNYVATGQCRDVWTQKNCRKSCKLCDVPYGVFIGCQDLDVCKKFASTACMVRWVRETCKSKCSQCGYERQANSNIVMGKKRHFPVAKPKQSDKIEKKNDATKKVQKVLKKITEKRKDELKKAAVKVQKVKQDIPKKTDKVKTNDKPESTSLKPETTVEEKAVPKDEEDDSEESGDESKVTLEKSDESDDDDDDDDDDNSSEDEDSEDQDDSGSSQDEDDDEENKTKSSGGINASSNLEAPIKMDEDPRGEPVVTGMVQKPVKFNDAPGKNVKIVKQKKVAKDAQLKVETKNVAQKVNNDKAVKKDKNVKKVQKS